VLILRHDSRLERAPESVARDGTPLEQTARR
jgi:hypothetical protein